VRRRVVVGGRVQGVWFRASAREQARLRGVAGWVRNLPDGTVEACFEGAPGDVEALVRWCAHGPEGARVDRLETFEEPIGRLEGFRVI
jgi:acylphosphatase